jgi:hypothetical protein
MQPPTGVNRRFQSLADAGIKDFTPASQYFDPGLYLETTA